MQIPKSFKLMGQTIKVVEDPTLVNREDWRGVARYRENTIGIQPASEAHPFGPDQLAQTFCHELMHFIFYRAGEHKLSQDERLVELTSNLLHQALTTMEY